MRRNNIVMQGGVEVEQQRLSNLSSVLVGMRVPAVGATEAGASVRLTNDPVADQLRVQIAQVDSQMRRRRSRLGTAHPQYKGAARAALQPPAPAVPGLSQSRAGRSQQLSITRRSVADLERRV
jgi:hypothetical protein